MSKLYPKLIIKREKINARKSIAALEIKLKTADLNDKRGIIKLIANERAFLELNFDKILDINEVVSIVHNTRHKNISKTASSLSCSKCNDILKQARSYENREEDLKPKFGNLIAVLEKEVRDELEKMERSNLPSQNDITRWALKDAVFAFYKNLNIPENTAIVDSLYDDRLMTQLAPDFDVIAGIWMERLDELKRRNDKYALDIEEYDKAEKDLLDGMRGSAFEKQLDRYREEFMKKLKG